MRSTLFMEPNLHVNTYLADPAARDFAGKACRNRTYDARYCPHGGQASHRIWFSRGQDHEPYGLCDGELRASATGDADAAACLLGCRLVTKVAWAKGLLEAGCAQDVAAPALKMTRLLTMMTHLASLAGNPCTLTLAGAYIFIRVVAIA